MSVDMLELKYSEKARTMKASIIRELLKLTQRPEIISFAGGLPNPKTFPVEDIKSILCDVLDRSGNDILQYGTTEGYGVLRKQLADRRNAKLAGGLKSTENNVVIVSGSQQGLDIVSKVFIDPGDTIIIGAPTYLGALSAFKIYNPKFVNIPVDEGGMNTDILEMRLKELRSQGIKPKFAYIIPTFQNPAGTTMPLERRKHMLELASEYDFLIAEDNPYGELRFKGNDIPTHQAMDTEGRVMYLGTLSKTFAPGFRVAWIVGHEDIIKKMVIAKQGADLCTNNLGQYAFSEFIARGKFDTHVTSIKKIYGEKAQIMLDSMNDYFPEDVNWIEPEGGLFTWVTMPDNVDTEVMFHKAIQQNVAYIIGAAFYATPGINNALRMSFSHPTNENIVEGIKRLGKVMKDEIIK